MKNVVRAVVLFALSSGVFQLEGCSSACLRHSDCNSSERCIDGTCIVITVSDGGKTVDGMTALPSATATATSTSSAPPSSTGAPSASTDAGSTAPTATTDASLDAFVF